MSGNSHSLLKLAELTKINYSQNCNNLLLNLMPRLKYLIKQSLRLITMTINSTFMQNNLLKNLWIVKFVIIFYEVYLTLYDLVQYYLL